MPVLAGDAGVVELAGEDFEGLAVEGEVVAFGGEDVGGLRGLRVCRSLGDCLGVAARGRRQSGEGERAGEERFGAWIWREQAAESR